MNADERRRLDYRNAGLISRSLFINPHSAINNPQ